MIMNTPQKQVAVHYGPFTVVFYKDDDQVIAHCLQVDVTGYGSTKDEARADLHGALELFILDLSENPAHWAPGTPPPEIVKLQDNEDTEHHMVTLVRVSPTSDGPTQDDLRDQERVYVSRPAQTSFAPQHAVG